MTSIRAALTDLANAVNELTKPITRKIHRDGGRWETVTAPSLLDQLREARYGGVGTSGAGRWSGSGSPLDLSAHLLLDTITTGTAYRLHTLRISQRSTPESALAALVAQIGSQGDPQAIKDTTDVIGKWVSGARRLLAGTANPRYLRGLACPACDTTNIITAQDGDRVITPAIRLDTRDDGRVTAAVCGHCGSWWDWSELENLAHHARMTVA